MKKLFILSIMQLFSVSLFSMAVAGEEIPEMPVEQDSEINMFDFRTINFDFDTEDFSSARLLNRVVDGVNKLSQDQEAIKSMAGCYEVKFNYAETFSYADDYEKAPDYFENALEWVSLEKDESDQISLQHVLHVQQGPGRSMNIKHWRQDWTFEKERMFQFLGDNTWEFENLEDFDRYDDKWSQEVYQVDDTPRYACQAEWVHVNGKSFWECQTDAPKARRDAERDDYNLLNRFNRHEITEDGWIHMQDNVKTHVDVESSERTPIVRESGRNYYNRVDDARCEEAKTWWESKRDFWKANQRVWNDKFDRSEVLRLHEKVKDKRPFEILFPKALEDHSKKMPVELESELYGIAKGYVVQEDAEL